MVERILRLGLFALVTFAGLLAYLAISAGRPVLGLSLAAAVLGSFAALLGVQFSLLATFGGETPARGSGEKLAAGTLLKAWLAEARCTPAVFFWRQPFRSHAIGDHVFASDQHHGVVLVHGYFCNRAVWNPWMRKLSAAGIPFIALSLEPIDASISSYVADIDRAVNQMEACTGRAAILVGHSMGGLAARFWWARERRNGRRLRRLITIGTPHRGTWLARFGHTRNGIEMRPGSPFLRMLESEEPPDVGEVFTCFYSRCDNIVFPPSRAQLTGARNVQLPGRPHLSMLDEPLVFEELTSWAAVNSVQAR